MPAARLLVLLTCVATIGGAACGASAENASDPSAIRDPSATRDEGNGAPRVASPSSPIAIEDPPLPSDPAWGACTASFTPGGEPDAALARLAYECAGKWGFVQSGPLDRHEQTEDDETEERLFRTKPGRCYRVMAVASDEVEDLDVAILGPEGLLIAGDLSRDRFSVVPPRGVWCPQIEGPFRIAIAVVEGHGETLTGVWSFPPDNALDQRASGP